MLVYISAAALEEKSLYKTCLVLWQSTVWELEPLNVGPETQTEATVCSNVISNMKPTLKKNRDVVKVRKHEQGCRELALLSLFLLLHEQL